MLSLMLPEPKVLDAIYSWCFPVFLFRNLFLHILVSDGKFTHKICSLTQFSFHLIRSFSSQIPPQNLENLCILVI